MHNRTFIFFTFLFRFLFISKIRRTSWRIFFIFLCANLRAHLHTQPREQEAPGNGAIGTTTKDFSKSVVHNPPLISIPNQEDRKSAGKEEVAMDADKKAASADVYDEELRDILIAISVIAKRLATKMETAARSGTQESKAKTSQGG